MINKNYVEKVKSQYEKTEPTKLEQLKTLHKKVKKTPSIFAYIFGSLASLVLGTGMCLAMNIIGGNTTFMILGIAIGVVGIILCCVTYPIYKKMINKRKEQYGSQIIALSNELINEQ